MSRWDRFIWSVQYPFKLAFFLLMMYIVVIAYIPVALVILITASEIKLWKRFIVAVFWPSGIFVTEMAWVGSLGFPALTSFMVQASSLHTWLQNNDSDKEAANDDNG